MENDVVKRRIREDYAAAIKSTPCRPEETGGSCCGSTCRCGGLDLKPGYSPEQLADLPSPAPVTSLGCGNPTALAEISPGEVVLDLGSGGGLDVLLSARRTGPTGRVYGLDMTDEMLAAARENQRQAGVTNVEFLKGDLEAIPLAAETVDLIISNCVINLAPDKDRAFAEMFRVLRPGGRLAVSDTVFEGDRSLVPETLLESAEAWSACIAGALEGRDYLDRLGRAGFVDLSLGATQVFSLALPPGVRLVSAFIRGRKPAALGERGSADAGR